MREEAPTYLKFYVDPLSAALEKVGFPWYAAQTVCLLLGTTPKLAHGQLYQRRSTNGLEMENSRHRVTHGQTAAFSVFEDACDRAD